MHIHVHVHVYIYTYTEYERGVLRDPPNSHQTHRIISSLVRSGAGDRRSRGFSGRIYGLINVELRDLTRERVPRVCGHVHDKEGPAAHSRFPFPFFLNSLYKGDREKLPAWNRDRSGPRPQAFYFLYSTNTYLYTYAYYTYLL